MELVKTEGNHKGMSSKRIAERTGKEHKHVIRDIAAMIEDLKKDGPNLDLNDYHQVIDNRGYISEVFLNERLSLCLASGYSTALRMKIIDAWAELKGNPNNQFATPKTFPEALRQLAEVFEAKEKLQLENEAQKPAVEFYDQVTGSQDAIAIGTVAKVLNMGLGQNKLFQFLREQHILMPNNQPYQQYIDCGYFRVVENKFAKPDGTIHIGIKTLVFQKGMDYIRKQILKRKAA